MPEPGLILSEEDGGIATITMNRPEKRNPLSSAMMGELITALKKIGERRDLRAVIIAGAGPAFSAGHDLSELLDRDLSFYRHVFDLCAELMQTIQAIPQPVIARVHGIATAAGCQLAASCDIVVASESAKFATPGVRIGLFCSTPMVPLSRAIGRKRAMQMLLTGALIDSRTAADWGLVNEVVPAEELDVAVSKLAAAIADASPLTLRLGKQAFYRQVDLDQRQAYDIAGAVMALNAMAADAQEGMSAFLEKRLPTWTGS